MQPSNLIKPALLAVDTKEWGGDGIVLTFPKIYKDIAKDTPYTPVILYHLYRVEAFCWMSVDGIEDAKDTMWDDTSNCPISIEEHMANNAMNEECPAWAMFEIKNIALIDKDKKQNETGLEQ